MRVIDKNEKKSMHFLKKYTEEKETIKNKTTYNILSEYGKGTTVVYTVIQGMYLILNDFEFKEVFKNDSNTGFSGECIVIDYCIKGKYLANFKDGKTAVVNKGNSLYYAGRGDCISADFKGKKYQSLYILCFLSKITESMEQLLGISRQKIEEYYEKLFQRKNILIVETDQEIVRVINDIYEYIKCDDVELIKLRAIELLMMEINHSEDYKSKKYYPKSIVDKTKSIKNFIEENMQEHITIADLAKKFDISETALKECFKYVYGRGIYTYLKNYRMKIAGELLKNSDYNVLEIANMTGYSNQSNFGAVFKRFFGVTPLKYKKIIK